MASAPLNWLLKIGGAALQTTAQTLSAAVNELKEMISNLTAVDIGYDSVNQGGIIDNVQAAIDDVYFKIEELDGAHVAYDNTSSGLAAVKVQGAIDETNDKIGTLTSLTTTAKSTVVAAINEVNSNINEAITAITVITTLAVDINDWVEDLTSQEGSTLYKKTVNLSHIYTTPSVDIGNAPNAVLPTKTEQDNYDLVQYVTYDDTVPCLYLYTDNIPTDTFYIKVEGVD